MSRQRISPPVKEGVFEKCGLCEGSGLVRSVDSVILNVLRKIQEIIASEKVKVLTLEISPEISNYILNHKLAILAELKSKHMIDFRFQIKAGLAYDNFKYTISEVWEPDIVQSPKAEDKNLESSEPVDKSQPSSRSRTTRSNNRSRTARPRGRSRTPKPVSEDDILRSTSENESSRLAVKVEEVESKKPETITKRKYTRRPSRRGPQRGRRRNPGQSKKEDDGASSKLETMGNSKPADSSRDDISGNIKSPMPPLPTPFFRENQDGEQSSTPKESASPSTDGSLD